MIHNTQPYFCAKAPYISPAGWQPGRHKYSVKIARHFECLIVTEAHTHTLYSCSYRQVIETRTRPFKISSTIAREHGEGANAEKSSVSGYTRSLFLHLREEHSSLSLSPDAISIHACAHTRARPRERERHSYI